MTSRRQFHAALLGAALALSAAVPAPAASADRNYLLATASTGGTFYPVGVAIATLIKVKLQPTEHIGLSAINSAGSAENVKLLGDNEAQFAILQGLYGHYAWNGVGPLQEPQKHLRSVTMLWQNVEQFLVKAEHVKTGTITDLAGLKGQPVAMGKRNSGTLGSNRFLLSNLALDLDRDFELFYGGYGPSADALQDGRVEAISTPAGVPTGAVTRLLAAMGNQVRMLDFNDEEAARADGGMGLWTRYVIPTGSYPGQNRDIRTIAQPNFLAVRADVDEDAVYLITKTIYENLAFLNGIHKATKAMALDKAIGGLPMPLHPGAARYYREAGLEIPQRLIAE
jgi:TRAP transporter TAXI family solute receptor